MKQRKNNERQERKDPQTREEWRDLFLEACTKGNLREIQELCEPRFRSIADIHTEGEAGFKRACIEGHAEIVRFLATAKELEEGGHKWVNVHTNNEAGFQLACEFGRLDVIKVLMSQEVLDAGHSFINIHADEERGLRLACEGGHLEVVKFLTTSRELIEAGYNFVNIHEKEELAFLVSCHYGQLEVVKFLTTSKDLLAAGHTFVNIHANDEGGFRWACENGDLELVRFLTTSKELIEAGHTFADIHALGEDGFKSACRRGNVEVVKFLTVSNEIEMAGHSRVNIHEDDDLGFLGASYGGHLEVIEFLTKGGELGEAGYECVSLKKNGKRAFKAACIKGYLDVIEFLVKTQGEQKICDWSKGVQYATENGHFKIIKFLLSHMESKNKESKIQKNIESALIKAVELNQWGFVEWLIFDYSIKETKTLKDVGIKNPKIGNYFRVREEQEVLKKEVQGDPGKKVSLQGLMKWIKSKMEGIKTPRQRETDPNKIGVRAETLNLGSKEEVEWAESREQLKDSNEDPRKNKMGLKRL